MKQTNGEKIFNVINCIFLGLLGIIMLYPFLYVTSASISDQMYVVSGDVVLIPKGINLSAYQMVLKEKGIWTAYANTIFYTIVGTAINMILTMLGAYPLSKKRLMGRRFWSLFIMFTMWFSAGTIPMYLNFKSLHLLNTRLSILIGFAVATYYVIIMRTYFESIPEALEESAKIDGANDLYILFKIYAPLSIPMFMTIGIYYAVERWNGYFWAMILLNDENKIPLQVLLKGLIIKVQGIDATGGAVDSRTYSKETITYATIVIAALPMIVVFPFVQKYFTKGMLIGAVKG